MDGGKVFSLVTLLVEVDDDEAASEEQERTPIEIGVDSLPNTLLTGRVGRLQDEDRLEQQDQAKDLGEGVPGEKDERADEDAAAERDGKGN